ncbi:MAG: hypothetical protein M0R00_02410 [Candidatus Omnitrophica bacterium]|nr:hypothetical protein [Candidatus Omnitrophota bacterium]
MKKIITFEKNAGLQILDAFKKSVDENGYIVEKSNPTQKVLTIDGEELALKDFAGIRKGSAIFIKSDLVSIINLVDLLQ